MKSDSGEMEENVWIVVLGSVSTFDDLECFRVRERQFESEDLTVKAKECATQKRETSELSRQEGDERSRLQQQAEQEDEE